ncbi:MAG: hypothetical protein J1E39_05435 [Eubacterium sp.]|nr:hypothetical protein [Eubacterium sp.]
MNRLNNMEFDASCKKTTAVIAGLLFLLAALWFADRAGLSPWLRFVVVFTGDLCACAIITLYCRMVTYALFPERGKARLIAFHIADTVGEVLKLVFLLLPIVIYGATNPLPQLLALITDIALSRYFYVGLLKSDTGVE